MLIGYEGPTPLLEDDAKAVLSLVWNCYPGHPWYVRCEPGLIFIRHMGFDGQWGMAVRVTEFDHDAAVLKKKIVMLTGEWLERAGMRRHGLPDHGIEKVEGVPKKYQPTKLPDDIAIKLGEPEERTELRPQVELA